MKRSIIVFAVAGLVIFSTLIWVFKMPEVSNWMEFIHIGVIFLVVMFALFVGYKRLTSERRGEPTEDELSKKVLQKTAALSVTKYGAQSSIPTIEEFEEFWR